MSQRDLHSIVSAARAVGPITLAADNTPVGVDLRGFQSAVVNLAAGVGGITFDATNKIEVKMLHGDTSTYGSATAVVQADVRGVTVGAGGIVKSFVAAHAAASNTRIGYFGGKPWLFFLCDFSGTHGTGTPICIAVERGHPLIGPA